MTSPKYTPTASAYAVAPVPPSRRGTPSSGMPGGHRVVADAFAGFAYQVGEGGQRHQLAVGE